MSAYLKNFIRCLRLSIVINLCFLHSCATQSHIIKIPLDPLSPAALPAKDVKASLDDLVQYLKSSKGSAKNFTDVQLILEAMVAERNGDLDAALSKWSQAMEIARGTFGERSFVGWLKLFVKKQGKKFERVELAKLVFSETKNGQRAIYLQERGVVTEEKLLPLLLREVAEFIEGEAISDDIKIDAPSSIVSMREDPLLTKLALEVCKYKAQYGVGWDAWRKSNTQDVNSYFDGLVLQCSGQSAKALGLYAEVAARLAAEPTTANYALEAYARMIKIRRDQGERESVAPLYIPLMQLWKKPTITEAALGMSTSSFEQRRLDDTMWAMRAMASVGDAQAAKYFADEVISYVSATLGKGFALTQEQKVALCSVAAETYHLLAFRLAVESKDWEKAANIAYLGLELPHLNGEWSIRLKWSLGIYKYLAGEYDAARRYWENILSEASDDKIRPAILFWTSLAHRQLQNKVEENFYRKSLADEYPLNFYSIVGLSRYPGDYSERWQEKFANVARLREELKGWQDVDIDDLRLDKTRGSLLQRAEILAGLNINPFANYALDELQKSFDIKSGEREFEWGVYLSRLYAASGNWQGAISMTTKLAKDPEFWRKKPEQMLVYFPRPFFDVYDRVSKELGIDASVLLGVSRQESSFVADIRSPANARGLMQVTPPTAKRLITQASHEELSSARIPESLDNPDINVRLGAIFLRELLSKYSEDKSKVFAAYNAGANTVDHWAARRIFDDAFVFTEMIPYAETRDYVKAVWRNELVYRYLTK